MLQSADFFRADNPEGMEARNEVRITSNILFIVVTGVPRFCPVGAARSEIFQKIPFVFLKFYYKLYILPLKLFFSLYISILTKKNIMDPPRDIFDRQWL